MDVTSWVSANIRKIREQKKLTLDAAAEVTGVSRSMLAQIEKGTVNPTISVLWKIANGYKTSFTTLVEPQADEITVVRAEEIEVLAEDGGRYELHPIFPFDTEKQFELHRVVVKQGGSLTAQPHMQGTQEYVTLFSGQAEIGVGEAVFSLNAGDSIRFQADVPHFYRNVGTQEVQMSMLIYYQK